ncbi:cupredoxin domain-containing protein [Streptomyces endophyticus]|uniref:Plastocyanin/azurin family copper-binding protein n=1 Tax=Streptomyces endophyticus TaxID=714166 RepID=A0ABU6F8K0_9ACTN|nr:plastocyanin/azurin family copper-binding protein [Streptomyces endophyticus]MEB8340346.1 plastocyanin/azurin family copper-binding protein [Streptomyces endophyticus]
MPRLIHRSGHLALATLLSSGAVVFLPAPAAHAAGHQVLMSDYKFGPRTLTIPVGDSVTWVNQDTAPHDVKTTSGPASIHSPMLDKGGTWSYTFTKAGSYGYVCTVHPGMTGGIVVKAAAPATRAPAPSTPPPAAAHTHEHPSPTPTKTSGASPTRSATPTPSDHHSSAAAVPSGPASPTPEAQSEQTPATQAVGAARPLDPLLVLAGIVAGFAVLCLLLVGSRASAASAPHTPERE